MRWQDHPPRYLLLQARALPRATRQACRAFLTWYEGRYPAQHHVIVEVRNSPRLRVAVEEEAAGQEVRGLWWGPDNPTTNRLGPKIYVAGRQAQDLLLDTFAHELAHYAEWARRGRTVEQGKAQRAQALLRQFKREVVHGH